jgi:hypothetical protein
VGVERGSCRRHQAAQPLVELGRALGLTGPAALLGDLAEAGAGRGRRHLRNAVLQVVDPVMQAGKLGQGGAQAPLLATKALVDRENQRGPAQGRRHRRPPGHETARRGVRGGEDPGQRGHPEPDGGRLRDRDRGHEEGQERPDRPSQRPEDLAQPVEAQHEEGVERELLERAAAAQAGEKGGRGDAEPEDESDGEPQARGRARGERPQEVEDGHDPGNAQDHLPRPPANGQVEDGATIGLRAALGPLTQAAG